LNDSVRLADEPCPCGRPFRQVEGVQGRVEDTLIVRGARGGQVEIRPLVFNRIMDILPVSGWQVTQDADDGLTVLLSGAREGVSDAEVTAALCRALAENGAAVPRLDVKRVPAIPKTAAGKAPLIRARSSHPAPAPVTYHPE
jgi:phenylacetate-CoA ligase